MRFHQGLLMATAGSLLLGLSISGVRAADAVPAYVAAAVADPGRPPADMVRDQERKPAELVAFSGIKPGDVVADFVPGGGYYTRILSKVVGPSGRVYAVVPMDASAPGFARAQEAKRRAEGGPMRPNPADIMLAIQNTTAYKNVWVFWESLFSFGGQFSLPEQLNAVWTTDNYHDLHNKGMAVPPDAKEPLDMAAVDKAIFRTLKPGGTFIVADHAAVAGAGFSVTSSLHRVDPEAVKAEIMSVGFELDAQSNLLANSNDDHTKPVFQMHDRTDQFVMRFKKPLTATGDLRPGKGLMDGYYGNTSHSGIGSDTQRWVFYHADGTYQEFGNSGTRVQGGLWYWDAAGHNCMLHQYPIEERGGIVCHDFSGSLDLKEGDTWSRTTTGRKFRMEPGYVYPPATLSYD